MITLFLQLLLAANFDLALTDQNFKFQVWKTNIAVDQKNPLDL
jgi:hypothetical protein